MQQMLRKSIEAHDACFMFQFDDKKMKLL